MSKLRVKRTSKELLKSVTEQIEFLSDFCNMYDSGNVKYAILIATRLRVLLHDTHKSTSLYTQLLNKFHFSPPLFMDTRNINNLHLENEGKSKYVSTYMCNYKLEHYLNSPLILTPVPRLNKVNTYLNFNNWWEGATILHWENNILRRRDIVLLIANQDGGAHVDENISKSLAAFKRQLVPSLKISVITDGIEKTYTAESRLIMYAVLRTIAKEVIDVFENFIIPYCKKQIDNFQK